MMAPLRKGDLFPPPYVAPLGGPRQGPPAAQCRLKNWTARSCLRAASRVANVPRFRLRPVRGSFFLEYRRYFPDGSFLIIARLLEGAPALRAQDAPVSSLRNILPCGHTPKPASALMCPARSSTTKRLPQDRAKSSARASGENGSSLLATTMLGNGKRTRGTGLKSRTSSGAW